MLGALLLLVIVFFVSCTGGDDDKRGAKGTGASQAPTPAPDDSDPDEEPSFSDAVPNGGPSLPAPEDLESQQPNANANPNPGANPSGGTTGNNANVTAPTDGSCADQEVSLTPLPSSASIKRGSPMIIHLKIKNISTRSCTRDLGAGAQELYLDQGARK